MLGCPSPRRLLGSGAGVGFGALDDVAVGLLAAAGHYGWVTAVRLDGVSGSDRFDAGLSGDLVLLPHTTADVLPDDRRHGGGLPPEVWTDTGEAARLADAAAKRGFRFGEIPYDASPETVLTRINTLTASE
ncbi:hypothetical protein FDG2_5608 [Candidatus Protofrankia californiensis]|uniref:Uncharacterized protein n=1 Tax=Candidatus Protofrankia californiensis TaxID=1839754 RepID=A0A1C3PEJ5_9ACTN|nr:hypothetical protein FDG2_5608 [Candidatus Protofrankia californiensis]